MKLVSKMRKKKNNKGFSLVELIVVVLIIAIIAVALAPQVMKWVGTARTSTDKNNSANIKSAVAVAVADYQSTGGNSISFDGDVVSTRFSTVTAGSIDEYIKNVLNGDYPEAQDNKYFHINVSSTGTITITTVAKPVTP